MVCDGTNRLLDYWAHEIRTWCCFENKDEEARAIQVVILKFHHAPF
jgi:hypothetical protein